MAANDCEDQLSLQTVTPITFVLHLLIQGALRPKPLDLVSKACVWGFLRCQKMTWIVVVEQKSMMFCPTNPWIRGSKANMMEVLGLANSWTQIGVWFVLWRGVVWKSSKHGLISCLHYSMFPLCRGNVMRVCEILGWVLLGVFLQWVAMHFKKFPQILSSWEDPCLAQ